MNLLLSENDDILKKQFLALKTPQDIANLLEVEYKHLVYYLYRIPVEQRYKTFFIKKKRQGEYRKITTPASALKIVQQKLNQVLYSVYRPKPSTHGFVKNKSIVSNASFHSGQRYIFNIDLEDFFPSINFGRVRGMFIKTPYNLPPKVATVLAQICCHDNCLPQGAPTSPVVSNMLCSKMDSQLQRLAKASRCRYTRYADDITFSTSMPKFPVLIGNFDITGQVRVGHKLSNVIEQNGFEINSKKIRLQSRNQHQGVTGLTINKFPNVNREYVRQLRAMLHAWKTLGLEAAEKEFHEKYDHRKDSRSSWKKGPSFSLVVKGKLEFLGMVKTKKDPVYLKYRNKLRALAPNLVPDAIKDFEDLDTPLIITGGKTDWKHIKAAFLRFKKEGVFQDLALEFEEDDNDKRRGWEKLKEFCILASKEKQNRPVICVFSGDEPGFLNEVAERGRSFKSWGNNIYSLVIPVPKSREEKQSISVEFLYRDEEIMRVDASGKRLFISTEFSVTGRHKELDGVFCQKQDKIKNKANIIDNEIYDANDIDIALSKNNFADNVLNQIENFSNFDISEFGGIFNLIVEILQHARKKKQSGEIVTLDNMREQVGDLFSQVQVHNEREGAIVQHFYHGGDIIQDGGGKTVTEQNISMVHSSIRGSAVAAENIQDSFNIIQGSTVIAGDLKEQLQLLAQAVDEMIKELPTEKADGVADDMKRLAEEATKKTPNKKWYSVSIDGLTKAAENVGEVGKPVIEMALKVAVLLSNL